MSNHITYPVRLNRYLYLTGISSRRQADRFIEQGLVKVNGEVAQLGQKIDKKDKVELDSKVKNFMRSYAYFAFNKPKGIVSHNPQPGEKSVESVFSIKGSPLYPVGRLDKASHGLMLLTNDGRIIDKLLNPRYEHEKEYVVKVDKEISESFINNMNKGVNIEGYQTRPTQTRQTDTKTFRIILTEGKKHQIRRMCAALGYQVQDLKRVRIMNIKLKNLPVGKGRALTAEEEQELLGGINLN